MPDTVLSAADVEMNNNGKNPTLLELPLDRILDGEKWYGENNTSKKAE